MSDGAAGLRRKIEGAVDLQSVVRTMKALAAANIAQYEQATHALADYLEVVELGLSASFRQQQPLAEAPRNRAHPDDTLLNVVVFGSDQGLVGRFNELVAECALQDLAGRHGKVQVWAVGERVRARLAETSVPLAGVFNVPGSVSAIAPLVGRILVKCEAATGRHGEAAAVPQPPGAGASFEPVSQQLLPLDEKWRSRLLALTWPTRFLPQVLEERTMTLRALLREYLFISLFRACAESLASENASRLAAMQRADQNIDEMLEQLHGTLQRVRQGSIDEELFDVVSGFEALSGSARR